MTGGSAADVGPDNCEVRKWPDYTTSSTVTTQKWSVYTTVQLMQKWSLLTLQVIHTNGPCEQCSYSTTLVQKKSEDGLVDKLALVDVKFE